MIADPSEPAKKKRNFRYEPEVSDISDSELVTTAMEAEKVMLTSAPTGFYVFCTAQKHCACATEKLTGGDKIAMNPLRRAAEMQELGKKRCVSQYLHNGNDSF